MQVIPSIDIYSGKSVRLTEGKFTERTEYEITPVDMAMRLKEAGARSLHLVDLEGAKGGRVVNWKAFADIAALDLDIQVGGGIRTEEDLKRLFGMGVSRVVLGSLAAKDPETVTLWASLFGPQHFCLAMDLHGDQLATEGWQEKGEKYTKWLQAMKSSGFRRFLSTDVAHDGKLQGPNFDLYAKLQRENRDVEWIASGGVGSMGDLAKLCSLGLFGVVVGKAIFEGAISLQELGSRYWGKT
jgi:phosphoribosylformimino-5-aminoimidazole carboxamide ribotide isomerase